MDAFFLTAHDRNRKNVRDKRMSSGRPECIFRGNGIDGGRGGKRT